MKISDIMTPDPVTCPADATLEQAAVAMWHHNCGAIPLVDGDGVPRGIVTDRDIAMAAALQHQPLWAIGGGQFANGRALYTCAADGDIEAAIDTMLAHRIRRLPIINHEGSLQGILSVDDVVARAEPAPRSRKQFAGLSLDQAMKAMKAVAKPIGPPATV